MVSENKSLFRLLLYKVTVILFYGLQNVCDPLLKIAPLNSKNVLNLCMKQVCVQSAGKLSSTVYNL